MSIAGLTEHSKQAFTEQQAKVLVEGAVAIEHDLVKREDFSKLTAMIERLGDLAGRPAAGSPCPPASCGSTGRRGRGFERVYSMERQGRGVPRR